MNDRLKELAKQSGIWFEDTKEIRTHSVSTTTLERFAELIVKECAGLVDHVIMEDGTRRSDFIRKHFGVDE